MGVIEGLVAEELEKISREAIVQGEWGIAGPDENETDIWIILRRSHDIQIGINYFKYAGIFYISYEVWQPWDEDGDEYDPTIGGHVSMFDAEIHLADPHSLRKVAEVINEFVKRGNMNVGAKAWSFTK